MSSPNLLCAPLLLFLMAGCSQPPAGQTVWDPNESANRRIHSFNKTVDRQLLSPVAKGYGRVVPGSVDRSISNFAGHLAIPGEIVNSAIQLNFKDVTTNTIRFLTNTVFGLGGFFDFATAAGMEEDVETDFGETLYVYGFPEGKFVELPFFGPRTERAAYGLVVNFLLDPVGSLVPAHTRKITVPLFVADKIGDRNEFDEVISGILYESEDSYVTSRSLYLQNRRFKLQGSDVNLGDLEDPYAN
ncbi:MAG: VacJ family lipoprotein [Rhodobacteraceae bacterium]|nr:VacJ family lipoprotein [Paracoccaceae bacterium]